MIAVCGTIYLFLSLLFLFLGAEVCAIVAEVCEFGHLFMDLLEPSSAACLWATVAHTLIDVTGNPPEMVPSPPSEKLHDRHPKIGEISVN